VCFGWNFKNRLKIVEKSKNSKLNFVVLSVRKTTTFSKDVYTFELQFLLEK
jgi:TRAP-type C4-dicarboxylate transport system substrate-binding protein